jgi:hypothetical protein
MLEAIRAYSIAVAPDRSWRKRASSVFMTSAPACSLRRPRADPNERLLRRV